MMPRTRPLAAFALAWLLCACSSQGGEPTQVLVVIDAESGVRRDAATMHILVQSGAEAVYDRTLAAAEGEIVLPYVLALVPKDGDASRRFQVAATVHDADEEFVAQVRATSGYVENRRVVLWLMLEDSCKRVSCEADQTCHNGVCDSAAVDPETLDALDDVDLPDSTPITPGVPEQDAGSDAAPPDAGDDSGSPGGNGGSVAAGRGGTGGSAGGTAGAGQGGTEPPPLCEDGEQQACGSGEGECSPGTQTCSDGEWGACTGQVEGAAEQCDGQDDDCDGSTDEDAPCEPSDLAHTERAACFLGTCRAIECESQWDDCNNSRADGCEQMVATLEHCGGCDDACAIPNASESCATGSCLVTACDPGWDDCNSDGVSCETQLGTIDDCSACNDTCGFANANAECANNAGVRSCRFTGCASSRYQNCDGMAATGCEVDLQTNPQHCGACNYNCATRGQVDSATCEDSACVFDCANNFLDCDGDPDNGCEYNAAGGICSRCFMSGTSNFAANSYTYPPTATVNFNCGGTHTFNTAMQTWDTGCCGVCPIATAPVAQTTAGGPQVVILRAASFNVASGTTLRLIGPYPVIFAVQGNATIAGVIDASANGLVPGPGGNLSCALSAGENGDGGFDVLGSSGGGGGGFGSAGGLGGTGNYGTPGEGGVVRGSMSLSPLLGGCPGGLGGDWDDDDCPDDTVGAGGGAFQVSVAGTLSVTGILRANGGAGVLGCGNAGGGSGGGSGGSILLEASQLQTATAVLIANGGAGGPGAGGPAGGAGSTSAGVPGSPGLNSPLDGGSGGGGGYGRVLVRDCLAP
jgi:hypothetical protein